MIASTILHRALLAVSLLGPALAMAQTANFDLKGSNEVPANGSAAGGSGSITVAADKTVTGNITTTGIEGRAAHIHTGAAGANGPVIVPLSKNGDNGWTVPAGAKLSEEQYAAYVAGTLYVNVHSAAFPGGEIRGQLQPK